MACLPWLNFRITSCILYNMIHMTQLIFGLHPRVWYFGCWSVKFAYTNLYLIFLHFLCLCFYRNPELGRNYNCFFFLIAYFMSAVYLI